jgi:hypothetical protein
MIRQWRIRILAGSPAAIGFPQLAGDFAPSPFDDLALFSSMQTSTAATGAA